MIFDEEFQLANEAIRYAESKHVKNTELFMLQTQVFQIPFENQKICNIHKIVDKGYSIRVITNEKSLGTSYGNNLERKEVTKSVDNAIKTSKLLPKPEKDLCLPKPKINSEPFKERYDKEISNIVDSEPEQSMQLAKDILEDIFACDDRIYAVMGDISFVVERKLIANSQGVEKKESRTFFMSGILVFAKDGNNKSRASNYFFHNYIKEVKAYAMSKKCASSSVDALRAKNVNAENLDIVFDPACLQQLLHFALLPATFADNIFQGRSFLTNMINKQVSSTKISMMDNGRHPQGLGSAETDDEGVPTQATPIIEKGILRGYLSDYITAQRYDCQATGNGIRWIAPVSLRSYRYVPMTGPTNVVLASGEVTTDDLVSDTRKGLLIKEVEDTHLSNFVTGNFFMKIVRAYLIRNGETLFPIKQRTLSGNTASYLRNVDLIANDSVWVLGYKAHSSMYLPTTRVRGSELNH